MRVLLVEDSAQHATLVREMLEHAAPGEFDLVRVSSVSEAVTGLLGTGLPPIDVVLLDLGLPDAAGLRTFQQVKTAALGAPVVVHSSLDDDETAVAAVREGAQDYLVKGRVDARRLARVLRLSVERGRRERALAREALHDPLTGLANRSLFADRLRQAVSRLGRTQWCLAVLFVDLDGFKQVNDREGHAAGDEILVQVADRLRATLRGGDTAARIGGDEFVVLCEDIAGASEARTIAGRLLEALPLPASAGVAIASAEQADPDSLLRAADAAMYTVKRRGGGGFEVAPGGGPPPGPAARRDLRPAADGLPRLRDSAASTG